jgi:hypothetical protein
MRKELDKVNKGAKLRLLPKLKAAKKPAPLEKPALKTLV